MSTKQAGLSVIGGGNHVQASSRGVVRVVGVVGGGFGIGGGGFGVGVGVIGVGIEMCVGLVGVGFSVDVNAVPAPLGRGTSSHSVGRCYNNSRRKENFFKNVQCDVVCIVCIFK